MSLLRITSTPGQTLPRLRLLAAANMLIAFAAVRCIADGDSPGAKNKPVRLAQLRAMPMHSGNPFLPRDTVTQELPVMINGYCLVTLRDQQKWEEGNARIQTVFDGKLYWFASPEQRAKFLAAPERYVPSLGGDCVVTFVQSKVRREGDPRFGLLHDRRLFFFASQKHLDTFVSDPQKFSQADLAEQGFCIVSQVDDNQQIAGRPELVVILNGRRYLFAGSYQRRQFLENIAGYVSLADEEELPDHTDRDLSTIAPVNPFRSGGALSRADVQQTDRQFLNELLIPEELNEQTSPLNKPGLIGYCPVTIHQQQVWVRGDPKYQVAFDGAIYWCVSAEEAAQFRKTPMKYVPALSGDCLVSYVVEGNRTPGSVFHPAQVNGRLYLFASEKEKSLFRGNPANYLDADLGFKGNCPVSWIDSGKQVAGKPEISTIHRGIRYFFASESFREKFLKNIDRYLEP